MEHARLSLISQYKRSGIAVDFVNLLNEKVDNNYEDLVSLKDQFYLATADTDFFHFMVEVIFGENSSNWLDVWDLPYDSIFSWDEEYVNWDGVKVSKYDLEYLRRFFLFLLDRKYNSWNPILLYEFVNTMTGSVPEITYTDEYNYDITLEKTLANEFFLRFYNTYAHRFIDLPLLCTINFKIKEV